MNTLYLHDNLSCTAPGTPTGVSVQALSCHTLKVTWSPPDQTGGLPIAGYNISYKYPTNSVKFEYSNNTTVSLQQLNPGTRYNVKVKAVNAIGGGEFTMRQRVHTNQRSKYVVQYCYIQLAAE